MNNDDNDIFSISSQRNGKKAFSIEKIKKSKIIKDKTHHKFHEKLNIFISGKNSHKKFKEIDKYFIINNQLQKNNSSPNQKNIMIINDIIETKTNHFLATFKDFLITDYVEEFLKRYFIMDECEELIPKFYLYYKNYLKFFCRGFFIDFKANKIIQDNGELQAELYYNDNYGDKNAKRRKKELEEKISESSNSKSKSKSETTQENKNNNTNTNISKINKIKLIFSKSIRKKLGAVESSKMIEKKELSNIFYKNKNETITLNDETKIYNNDNIYTDENSLIHLLNILINKRKSRKKLNENKIVKNNINEKNIVNIYKNLLSQSPIKSERYQNYIKNGIYNKTSKKVSSIKIFNKNIPIILKNKNHNLSNDMKTPLLEKTKLTSRNNQSRNSRTNFSSKANNSTNIFVRNSKSKNSRKKRKNSKSILTRLNIGNYPINKTSKGKYSTFNKNLRHKKRKKAIYTGFYFKNMSNNSSNNSRNLKQNFIYSFHSNNINNNTNNTNNNQRINNKIKHYQYMTFKNKTLNKHKIQNKIYKNKQNCSLSNSNSIYNNFHININNNIMLLNNNSNIKHIISNKNNTKSTFKTKKYNHNINNINNYNYKRSNKNIVSRNENNIDINKYKTEIKSIQANLKKKHTNNKNIYSSIKKYMSLEKSKSRTKDKISKNKEQLIRNKSNLLLNNIRFKLKKNEKSEMMPSLKNFKKLNKSNRNLNTQNGQKINIIFDYKKK